MHFKIANLFLLFVCALAVQKVNRTSQEEIHVATEAETLRSEVFIQLSPSGRDSGIVNVYLPNISSPLQICYPTSYLYHLEASKLIHVLCKQLGHVTFDLKYEDLHTTAELALLSTSAQCTGREDNVSECPWGSLKTRKCRRVLATRCSSCNYKYWASHGSVYNPGYPHTYLFSVTCEWSIEIPEEEQGIELKFEEFALPQAEKDDCSSYIELIYGKPKSVTHYRFCPADKVSTIIIPFKKVRIQFSTGTFRSEYENEQGHYALHISYTSVPLGISSSSVSKISFATGGFLLIAVSITFCYCCQYYIKTKTNRDRNRQASHIQANASEAQFESDFQRCALHIPRRDNIKNTYMSDNSSSDSYITRWKSETNLPVTAALAPTGPDGRTISIATTPRSVFPPTCRVWSEGSARIEKVRTKLIARFSSTSTHNNSDVSVFLTPSEKRTYSRLSCEEEIPLETIKDNAKNGTSEGNSAKVPNIVVEFVS